MEIKNILSSKELKVYDYFDNLKKPFYENRKENLYGEIHGGKDFLIVSKEFITLSEYENSYVNLIHFTYISKADTKRALIQGVTKTYLSKKGKLQELGGVNFIDEYDIPYYRGVMENIYEVDFAWNLSGNYPTNSEKYKLNFFKAITGDKKFY